MEVIKKKIATLKNALDAKDEEVQELRSNLKHEQIEREKAENEAAAQTRKVIKFESRFLADKEIKTPTYNTSLSVFYDQNFFTMVLIHSSF